MPEPIIPPVADPVVPPVVPPVPTVPPGGDDENKFRRLHEKSEAEKKQLADRLASLEAAEKSRKDAELSDVERATKRADEAEARAAKMEHERLVNDIAAKHHLTSEAREFLAGANAAELELNAQRLAAVMKQPVSAGTTTQPPGTPPLSLEQQRDAAMKSGNSVQAIKLAFQLQHPTS